MRKTDGCHKRSGYARHLRKWLKRKINRIARTYAKKLLRRED